MKIDPGLTWNLWPQTLIRPQELSHSLTMFSEKSPPLSERAILNLLRTPKSSSHLTLSCQPCFLFHWKIILNQKSTSFPSPGKPANLLASAPTFLVSLRSHPSHPHTGHCSCSYGGQPRRLCQLDPHRLRLLQIIIMVRRFSVRPEIVCHCSHRERGLWACNCFSKQNSGSDVMCLPRPGLEGHAVSALFTGSLTIGTWIAMWEANNPEATILERPHAGILADSPSWASLLATPDKGR